jgi:hypothetical protein
MKSKTLKIIGIIIIFAIIIGTYFYQAARMHTLPFGK